MTFEDDTPDDDEGSGVGYRKPPKATRFTKGRSGNSAGRPRGRRRQAPYEAVLGRMVTIREGATTRRVTAAEAFLLNHAKLGVEGDIAAARASLAGIEEAKERIGVGAPQEVRRIVRVILRRGSLTPALERLRMAIKLDPYRETARMALEPWLVEAALARLPQPLNPADQQIIVKSTRTPVPVANLIRLAKKRESSETPAR